MERRANSRDRCLDLRVSDQITGCKKMAMGEEQIVSPGRLSSMLRWKLHAGFVLLILGVTGWGGCSKPPAPPPPQAPQVGVSHPLRHEVIEWDVYTGRLS